MIKPIGVNIAVEKDPKQPCKEGGIFIPESLERTPRFGPSVRATVIGIGNKVKELKVGDRIVLKDVAGDDYLWGDKTITILREKDIVGMAL